jgi:zinc protease
MTARTSALVATLVAITALSVSAQQTLDRTKRPVPGKPPVLNVPAWTSTTLANGAELIVSERHGLPLVSFQITFQGGANQYEPADRRGLASLVSSMMSEGTKTRDADAVSTALQMLGTGIGFNVGGEGGSVGFQSTTANFEKTLAILSEMLETPAFPQAALDRLKAQRLVTLTQSRVQPAAIAGRVYPRLLYGAAHPFGQSPTEASYTGVTRDDVVAFHQAYFQPGRALISVVGDVTAAGVKTAVERALAAWPKAGSKPAFAYPALPDKRPATIYLVDKPGAAQSTFAIGNPGPPRTTPDYFALQVMNFILGANANFQSRLNANIREDKGYSYGINSSFQYGKGPGAFRAGGDVVSAKTDLALIEFMKELRGIAGGRPITDEELKSAKDSLVQVVPGQFASVTGVNGVITTIWSQGLPADYYQQLAANFAAVTKADVLRVAKQYIDLDHLTILIVGDRASIEAPLKATGIAPIVAVDIDGNIPGGK